MATEYIKMTAAQMQAIGMAIMADPRCDAEVKAAVRRGITGNGDNYSYTTHEQHTWYDQMFVAGQAA